MSGFDSWLTSHYADYLSALTRVEKTRTLLLSSNASTAASVLKKAYAFAVFSIKTPLERHEQAFTAYYSGGLDLEGAAAKTVYGNQKAGWMQETLAGVDWEALAAAVQCHVEHERYETLLDTIEEKLKGVSHRKGAFMLAMSGLYEYLCIDSNIAKFAGLEESDAGKTLTFDSSAEYLAKCEEIFRDGLSQTNLPPFLVQWACYDYMRGEHARHMSYYREVLPEVLWRD
jgi:hypothetical protein